MIFSLSAQVFALKKLDIYAYICLISGGNDF